ncbi:MAG: CHAP domain-containing protein, partial [Staphylococcus epidermidis]|nr:CHAP domain-containing protein [Staphylococcus epidermidis]
NKINNTWSDAKHWDKKAIDDGYIVDRNPKKGSILQSSKGKYGHVAYIETINEDGSIQVSEMNYTQPYEITKRTIHTYEIKNYYYIHPQKIKT